LLNGRLNGENLPNVLPDSVAQEVISVSNSIQSSMSPVSPATNFFGNNSSNNTFNVSSNSGSIWTLSNEEKMKYYDIFKQYDTFNTGHLSGNCFILFYFIKYYIAKNKLFDSIYYLLC